MKSIVTFAERDCPSLLPMATHIRGTFQQAFTLFAKCHNIYDSTVLTPQQINSLGMNPKCTNDYIKCICYSAEEDIKEFMAFYRKNFAGASVKPKFHLLGEHVLPLLRQWGLSFGFVGEQGGESIHSQFNNLERIYANIPNMEETLECFIT